jgi:virginiamycin B lyase
MGPGTVTDRIRRLGIVWAASFVVMAFCASQAEAFVYWANTAVGTGTTIGRAELDGTGVDQDFIGGATAPCGVAVNATHVYWANLGSGTIGRANLDGTDPDQSLVVGEANPCGVVVGSSLYWANQGEPPDEGSIRQAFLSGGPGSTLHETTAVSNPCGVAINTTHIYWANGGDNTVGRGDIDSSSNSFSVSGVADAPCGVAVAGSNVYWANSGNGTIARANLDFGGGTDLGFIAGANAPCGVAVHGGFLYWTNSGDGTIGRAPLDDPDAADQSFINGANAPCGVAVDSLASPPASPPSEPLAPSPEPSNDFTFGKAKKNKSKGTAKLAVNVPGPGQLELLASEKVKGSQARAEAGGEVKLPVKPKGRARSKLQTDGRAKVAAEVTFVPDGGEPNTQTKRLKLVDDG